MYHVCFTLSSSPSLLREHFWNQFTDKSNLKFVLFERPVLVVHLKD